MPSTWHLPNWLDDLAKNTTGIRSWCFLRTPEQIAFDSRGGKDIDLWCSEGDIGAFIRLLFSRGWSTRGGRCISWHGNHPACGSIRFSNLLHDAHPNIELHFGNLRWRLRQYCPSSVVEASIERIGGFPFVTGPALLCILITRSILRGNLQGKRLRLAQTTWENSSKASKSQWRTISRDQLTPRAIAGTEQLIEEARTNSPTQKNYSKFHIRKKVLMHPLSSWNYIAGHLANKLSPFRKTKRGILLGLIGTDGSGKTTAIAAIKSFAKSRNMAVDSFYWGRSRENSRFAQFLKDCLYQSPIPGLKEQDLRHSAKAAQTLALLWILQTTAAPIYAIDFWIRYRQSVLPRLKVCDLVLLDRGPADILLMKGFVPILHASNAISPKPHLLIYCFAPRSEILKRKQERSENEIERHQRIHSRVAKRGLERGSSLLVDTSVLNPDAIALRAWQAKEVMQGAHRGATDRKLCRFLLQQLSSMR